MAFENGAKVGVVRLFHGCALSARSLWVLTSCWTWTNARMMAMFTLTARSLFIFGELKHKIWREALEPPTLAQMQSAPASLRMVPSLPRPSSLQDSR